MKIQYVIVRNDTGFPRGATAAQAVHAVTACQHEHLDQGYLEYISEGAGMHTAVLQCTQEEMAALVEALRKKEVKFSAWVEMPENMLTAVAIYPYEKARLQEIKELRRLKLY
ncbi:uncharacterized protein NEMAJ01_1281 [Nematocida major]|uniref:uncharacterized protein n=1 Tax=Nematocida major TaxID=1912982 RepID=UPI0020079C92|nr:uncharacterized protein NEMAJ01_1281 [Nematocida major]KAH9386385.1 hypothetical protein NEMAJ01_1281 [Nematocida major]